MGIRDRIAFIGIDPSINSTGVVVRVCDSSTSEELYINYYILKGDTHEVSKKTGKPKPALTKRELDAQARYENFRYVLYDKQQTVKDMTVENETAKTLSFMSLVSCLTGLVKEAAGKVNEVCVVMEGISYGSTIRTSSVFDLAGLNYMIRAALMKDVDCRLIVSPPAHVKKFATGTGNANKELMTATFRAIHPELDIPKIDDIADAFFMSRMAQHSYLNCDISC